MREEDKLQPPLKNSEMHTHKNYNIKKKRPRRMHYQLTTTPVWPQNLVSFTMETTQNAKGQKSKNPYHQWNQ